jgi:hypothetical protein
MALGDITYDAGGAIAVGNRWQINGSIEISSTATEFAIASSRHITSAHIHNIDDVDATVQVVLNSDDGTEGTASGSIWVDSSSSGVDTHDYTIQYI